VVQPRWTVAITSARRDPARFGLDPARRTLFVVGGSLGAAGLNQRARAGLLAAVAARPALANEVQVIHAAGTPDEADAAQADYARAGLRAHVRPFLAEIGEAYMSADLVLSRGGAGTVAELAALHRPAVIVPYPHHADRQQWKNAAPLVDAGQAVLVEEGALDASTFAREVLGRLLAPAGGDPAGGGAAVDRGAEVIAKDCAVAGGAAATLADALVRSNGGAGGVRSPA
jgi:UDP-N-acetylglucosamine--N-acetylmuramyl-(pentapeptide) pyrophosphoryl-undecaprenol N-acetylglucosamine transferase